MIMKNQETKRRTAVITMEASESTKHVDNNIIASDLKTVCVAYIIVSDLLPSILCRLPSKPLIQFSLVCKQWYTLITKDSRFHRLVLKYQKQTPVGLLLLVPSNNNCFNEIKHIHFSSTAPRFLRNLDFIEAPCVQVLQACNGLLLCYDAGIVDDAADIDDDDDDDADNVDLQSRYYICNPMTKQYLRIFEPHVEGEIDFQWAMMYLAFDPAKSPYYKIVAIIRLQIFIYSSNTRRWRRLTGAKAEHDIIYGQGVYWNGAINWVRPCCPSFYLHIENETLKTMPSVPLRKSIPGEEGRNGTYCEESCGHLYFAETGFTQIDIYEMKRDYSEWCITRSVNLLEIDLGDYNYLYRQALILSVVCGEVENDSFLVLTVPGKVIRCGFANNTCQKLGDIKNASHSFHYIESLCSV